MQKDNISFNSLLIVRNGFGGLWIEHEPNFRVVVLFTRKGERTIRPYLAGEPYAHLVEVRQARYTLAE